MPRPLWAGLKGTAPSLPIFIGFTGTGVEVLAAAGTVIGTLATSGGASPYTYTCSNTKFQIVGNQVQRSSTGILSVGVSESLNFTSTDAHSNSTDTSTNGQGPFTVAVSSTHIPTGVISSPQPISIPATTAGNTVIATLTEQGGTGVNTVISVTGNSNLTVDNTASPATLKTVASPSFTQGVNQTYSLHVTDTGGTYDDASPRTLTVQSAAAPTGVTQNPYPLTILANTAGNTVLASLGAVGGTAPYTFAVLGNANLTVSGSNLQAVASPTFTANTTPTYYLQVTDANNLVFTEAVGSRTYTVPAGPTDIASSPDTINDNAQANDLAATLTPVGGTAPGTWAITTGLTAFNIVASGATSTLTLKSAAVGTLTPGQTTAANQGTVTYTDAAGLSTSAVTVNVTVLNHASSSLIASFTAVNTSTTTDTAAHANTIMFGHPFRNGQIATGTYPIFKMFDGVTETVCPFSYGQIAPWETGTVNSRKFGVGLLQLPAAVAHNGSGTGSVTIRIYSNGSAPAASSRTTTDITANTDFNMNCTILDSPGTDKGGSYTCHLNDCISDALASANNATIETYADGPAGKVYVINGAWKSGSTPHGQMRGTWYVQVLQTNTGTLGGFRVLGFPCMPNWDVDSPAKGMRVFSAFTFKNGSTLIRDIAGSLPFTSYTFNWVAGTQYRVTSGTPLYGTGNGGFVARVSNAGSLPTGALAPNTNYYISKQGTLATDFLICTTSPACINGTTAIASTAAGSGNSTLQIYPAMTQFSGFYTCGTTAMYDCFDATGASTTDTTIRFQMDTNYWISTKVLLPYKVPAASSSNKPNQSIYVPNGSGGPNAFSGVGNGILQGVGQTGDVADLGPISLQYSYHLFNQTATDELTVRCNGLCAVHYCMVVRTSTDGRIPAVNNGSDQNGAAYSGMSGPFPTMRWSLTPGDNLVGHTLPTGTSLMTFSELSPDHYPEWSFYPLLVTGEPQFRDRLIESANANLNWRPTATAISNAIGNVGSGTRSFTVGANTYYGTMFGDTSGSSARIDAWTVRSMAQAKGILAAGMIEKTYFGDCLTSSFQCLNAQCDLIGTLQPFANTIGVITFKHETPGTAQRPYFQDGYRLFAVNESYRLAEIPDALTTMNYLTKLYDWIDTNMGGAYHNSVFSQTMRLGRGGSPDTPSSITKANPGVVTGNANVYENDRIIFTGIGGMTQLNGNIYIAKNVSGSTLQLYNLDGTTLDTTGFGTFTGGGYYGTPYIQDITHWVGQQNINLTYAASPANPSFTAVLGNGDGAPWVNYTPVDGDCYYFDGDPTSFAVPGMPMWTPMYCINTSGMTFNLTTVAGDAGHIVRPTASGTNVASQQRRLSPPTDKCNYSSNAATFQLIMGSVSAAAAVGGTVSSTTVNNLQSMFTSTVNAGRCTPNVNSKYLMNSSY